MVATSPRSFTATISRSAPRAAAALSERTRTEQVTQPAITQLVTRLERDGLVERRPDPSDGRAVLVHITEAGRQIGRSRHEDRTRHLAPLLSRLTAEQRQAIADALPALARLAELGRGRRLS
ncbi:MarR family winged helix-turn-helix transcriptional regulator [Streptomyces sp. ME19-01-6]|uniref:MarR family winged helix-turn-helix transcriptional regulator n=1 Tax=Streptomyces sp. ME19-01-6 TaxID=3028686 RepID=UPI0029ACAC38|nr:MarR family transcriptional regulator [Streptomyces sp. ME19-01-6]MDX3225634.1 MarR family transcriptional regulator [Streptomyces sp. ME19-01-6]